jgi:hypothetical protein
MEKSSGEGSPPSFPHVYPPTTPISLQFLVKFHAHLHRVDELYVDRFRIILGQILELSVNWFRSLHLSHELSLITNALYSPVEKIYLMVYNMYLSIK